MLFQFSASAWEEYLYWQGQDRHTLKRINDLLLDISRNGYGGIGKPEALRGKLSGFWSHSPDEKNRLVYRIIGGTCEIIQCKYHYS